MGLFECRQIYFILLDNKKTKINTNTYSSSEFLELICNSSSLRCIPLPSKTGLYSCSQSIICIVENEKGTNSFSLNSECPTNCSKQILQRNPQNITLLQLWPVAEFGLDPSLTKRKSAGSCIFSIEAPGVWHVFLSLGSK